MRKFLLASALASSMWLGGCATMGGPGGLGDFIKQVQQITVQACGFLPLASTVAGIISAGQFTEGFAIANAICAAVTAAPPPQLARGVKRRLPVVSGVVVRGRFVVRRARP